MVPRRARDATPFIDVLLLADRFLDVVLGRILGVSPVLFCPSKPCAIFRDGVTFRCVTRTAAGAGDVLDETVARARGVVGVTVLECMKIDV